MRRLPVVISLTGLLAAAACGSSSNGSPSSPASLAPLSGVHIQWHTVTSALSSPVGVTNDGVSSRVYVVEHGGTVRIVRGKQVASTPYLNLTNETHEDGEGGLLSIAFHPGFKAHPTVYAAYTRNNHDLVVSSFKAKSAGATTVKRSTERHIIVVPHRGENNHNGGQIFFGNDGDLYVTTGDGGSEGDPFKRADKRNNLTGKILRINVNKSCGKKHYCIPASNPYAGSKKYRPEVIAWGLRNPWRTSLDPATNTLWIGEVGQDKYEEIDHVGIPAAHDFGWSCKEANSTYHSANCGHRHITPPVQVIPHSPQGNCAIIGGVVYRGHSYAAAAGGLYVYADYCSGRVWGLRKAGGNWHNAQIGSLNGGVSGIGQSKSGEIYAVTVNDSKLFRATFSKG